MTSSIQISVGRRRPLRALASLLACLALAPAAALAASSAATSGHTGHGASQKPPAVRTIEVRMDDKMRFYPDRLQVAAGETVRLRVTNDGRLEHELVLGQMSELIKHAKAMREQPAMAAHHEANAITVAPGQTGELLWTFKRAGTLDFACLLPGHREAGMVGKVRVAKP